MELLSFFQRRYSSASTILSANEIRSTFLNYFANQHGHALVKPSPVVSYFDHSIPFVNAGMCQFKRIFTGDENPDWTKVANSQKCIRIGGKHNDLNVVGKDSFHHTFFEMLGNWSFGSYSKKDACSYAWKLLTSAPYLISPNKLFVTYFGGDETLTIPADNDVREIWLELGVHPKRIIPFGIKDNFWEMGLNGPCGTCSEIHVALTENFKNRPDLVNCDNPLLCELWNIVFIKYNKNDDEVTTLPCEFIDTGMGLERLVSLLQQKTSNYDTDLFQPLMASIENICRCPAYVNSFAGEDLNASYRRLADFSRMITVAISDNVFPDMNGKLRRVLRKSLHIARNSFQQESPDHLLIELAKVVSESLCDTFPEVGEKLHLVESVIKDEEKLLIDLLKNNQAKWSSAYAKYSILRQYSFIEYPGLPKGYEHLLLSIIDNGHRKELPPEKVNHLYNTYGLDTQIIEDIISALNIYVDWDTVRAISENVKIKSKKSLTTDNEFESILNDLKIKTNDSFKYHHMKFESTYFFPEIKTNILAIIGNGKIKSVSASVAVSENFKRLVEAEVDTSTQKLGLIFDQSNFSVEIANRRFDKGWVTIDETELAIVKVDKLQNSVVHYIQASSDKNLKLRAGCKVALRINQARKLRFMKHNLLGILVLAEMKKHFPLIYVQYDNSEDVFMNLRLCFHGSEPDLKKIRESVRNQIRKYIDGKIKIDLYIARTKKELLSLPEIYLRPGYIYPTENIRVVSLMDQDGNIIVREPCDHVICDNIECLDQFCIVNIERVGNNILSVTGVVDDMTKNVSEYNTYIASIIEQVDNEQIMQFRKSKSEHLALELSEQLDVVVPILTDEYSKKQQWFFNEFTEQYQEMVFLKQELDDYIISISDETVVDHLKSKMNTLANLGYVVYFSSLNCRFLKENDRIADMIKYLAVPTLFFYLRDGKLKGICYIPEDKQTKEFNPETWLKSSVPVELVDYAITGNLYLPQHRYLGKIRYKNVFPSNLKEILTDRATKFVADARN